MYKCLFYNDTFVMMNTRMNNTIIYLFLLGIVQFQLIYSKKPNVLIILADDLGMFIIKSINQLKIVFSQ